MGGMTRILFFFFPGEVCRFLDLVAESNCPRIGAREHLQLFIFGAEKNRIVTIETSGDGSKAI